MAGAVAGGEGFLAYMLLAYEPYFIIDLVRDFIESADPPRLDDFPRTICGKLLDLDDLESGRGV